MRRRVDEYTRTINSRSDGHGDDGDDVLMNDRSDGDGDDGDDVS